MISARSILRLDVKYRGRLPWVHIPWPYVQTVRFLRADCGADCGARVIVVLVYTDNPLFPVDCSPVQFYVGKSETLIVGKKVAVLFCARRHRFLCLS